MRIIWRRLLTNPATRIESVEGDIVRLRVEGLVCDRVCAARTKRAVERIEGVRDVQVDFESGVATISGQPADAASYERAVRSAVAGRPLRRAVDALALRLRRPAGRSGSMKGAAR